MKRLVFMLTVVLSCALSLTLAKQADAYTFDFSGNVTQLYDNFNELGGAINVGDTMVGSFSYDLGAPDTNFPSIIVGDYWHYSIPYGITVNINGNTFQTDPSNVSFLAETVNDYPYCISCAITPSDHFVLRSYNNINASHISWQLDDFTGTAISDTNLPTSFNLSAWTQIFALSIENPNGSSAMIRGVVTSIQPATSSVPEPSTILLLGSGLAGFAGIGIMKRRKKG